MPQGTSVHKMYEDLVKKGYSKKTAAKMAQARTGLALVTGKPPKMRTLKLKRR